MNIVTIFITGLFAGGLTCLAVQGGLLASSIAQREKDPLDESSSKFEQILPVLSFLITRLIAYTILGFILGALGSVAQLSIQARIFLQFAIAFFMIGTALNLLQIHPIFRYFVIQPPKFLTRLVRNQSKSKNIFGPALLGAFTILIPCGATQAMMAYTVSTGSPIIGAATMFTFILGTSPLFFLLGYAARKLGQSKSSVFNKIAALAIIIIALFNINSALALSGSNFTFENMFAKRIQPSGNMTETVSEATIYLTQTGYKTQPSTITVKGGTTVKLKLINQGGISCIQAFTIPKLGIQRIVPPGKTDEIVFTVPNISGTLPFMCSMGMYRGIMNVL